MNNEQVTHLWAHKREGRTTNLRSDGKTLYSYGTAIAVWHGETAFISSDNMTPTTGSKHLSPARSAVSYNYFSTPAFRYGCSLVPSAENCILAAAQEMDGAFRDLLRKRVHVEDAIERYNKRKTEIQETASLFNVTLPDMPEVSGDLKEKAKELRASDKKKKEVETRRKEERERAEKIIAQGELDLWLQQGRGRFPNSFRERGNDRISIKGDYVTYKNQKEHPGQAINSPVLNVITSQGAEAPLDHVIKALRFYDSRILWHATGTGEPVLNPYHTNGHKIHLGAFTLDEITENGDVKAGCHYFKAEEIARFRAQWKGVLNND